MSNKKNANRTRVIWLLLLAGLVILLFWAGLKTWRIYRASSSLLERQDQVQLLLADGPGNIDPVAGEELVYGLRSDVVSLKNEMAFFIPLLPYLNWIPKVGPLAASTPQLIEMADAGTESLAYAFRGLQPTLSLMQKENDETSKLPQALQMMEQAQPDLAAASIAMDRLVTARNEINNENQLPWRVRTLLERADEWLPLAQGGLKMTLVIPDLLGVNGPRRYLIIAQNEDEIRATGGFISGAGLIELEKGRISKLDFQDANSVDAWAPGQVLTKPYGEPPQALTEMMLLDLFLFRDANFWPHYPISAEKAMDLYSYGQDAPPLDGAIAIDQQFIERLVSGTGPVQIADTGEVVNEANAIKSLQDAWTLEEGVGQRKAFLGVFAQAIRNRLENEFSSIDPVHLARQIGVALNNKDLQIYMRNPLTASVLAATGWDGRLVAPTTHDALIVVDTNMGYNKANIFIERDLSYNVQLASDGSAQADLTITHSHTGTDDGEPCSQGTLEEYAQGGDYQDLTEKCYWNYLRVYVPENSQLLSGPQHVVPAETWYGAYDWDRPAEIFTELPGFTTFANFMLVPKGAELTSEYIYQLPNTITENIGRHQQYRLKIYKQAGIGDRQVEVSVTIPPGTRIISSEPKPTHQVGETMYYNLELDSDQTITIAYD